MAIDIRFTPAQRKAILDEAQRRQTVNERDGRKGRNGGAERGQKALFWHQLGCAGEYAVALMLNCVDELYQDGVPVRGSVDLPGWIDVKTRSKHHYDLLVQKDEDPTKTLVLVTCQPNTPTKIHGWIKAEDAMKPEYWKEWVPGRGCYSFPQSKLNHYEANDSHPF